MQVRVLNLVNHAHEHMFHQLVSALDRHLQNVHFPTKADDISITKRDFFRVAGIPNCLGQFMAPEFPFQLHQETRKPFSSAKRDIMPSTAKLWWTRTCGEYKKLRFFFINKTCTMHISFKYNCICLFKYLKYMFEGVPL